MAAATMLMYEYESDLRSNEHYLSSSENKARKNSGPYGIWTHAYSFLSPQFTYMIFIYLQSFMPTYLAKQAVGVYF